MISVLNTLSVSTHRWLSVVFQKKFTSQQPLSRPQHTQSRHVSSSVGLLRSRSCFLILYPNKSILLRPGSLLLFEPLPQGPDFSLQAMLASQCISVSVREPQPGSASFPPPAYRGVFVSGYGPQPVRAPFSLSAAASNRAPIGSLCPSGPNNFI